MGIVIYRLGYVEVIKGKLDDLKIKIMIIEGKLEDFMLICLIIKRNMG